MDLINTVDPLDVVNGVPVYELDEELLDDGELEEPPEAKVEEDSESSWMKRRRILSVLLLSQR